MSYVLLPAAKRAVRLLLTAATALLILTCTARGADDVQGSRTFVDSARAMSGDSLEVFLPERTAIALIGIRAPQADPQCRERARSALAVLVKDGVTLIEPKGVGSDASGRRLVHAFTPDGRDIALAMIEQGLATALDTPHRFRDQYRQAQQKATATPGVCF